MKVGEILRKIADQIDAIDAKKSAEELVRQSQAISIKANAMAQDAADKAMAQAVDQAPEPEVVDVNNSDCTDTETMVPPLQQKHELLKKATGVENNVETFAINSETEDDGDTDTEVEIAMMKKLAGVNEPEQCKDVSEFVKPVEVNPRKNAALSHFASDNYDAE